MRKQGLAVLLLTAAMTLGSAGICALAAEGWVQENGSWAYYNSAGSRVTDAWRKGSDNLWRYLNSSGYMAVSSWVDDDDYYVNESGVMLANQWLQVANSEKDSGYDYYYFTSTGKCVKDKWEKVNNNWYHFDDTGVMETGWILDDMYYCDTNGVMLTGWQRLEPPDGADNENDGRNSTNTPYYVEDDGKYWYYFSTSGKKVMPNDDSSEIGTKKINGTYYALDQNGAVQFGWVCTTGDDSDDIGDYRFVNSDGTVRTGWYSLEPPEHLRNEYEHDVEWFYFSSRGVPEVGPAEGSASTKDLKRINGNTYLFNDDGNPVYGLQKVYTDTNGNYTAYYFGTYKQSSMLKGLFKLDIGGDTDYYYFSSTGKGYTGVYENYLYYMGRRQKAETKYEVFSIPSDSGNSVRNYVVNTSGRIAKSTTVRDSNGTKLKTSSSGILTEEDDEKVAEGTTYSSPAEPDWDYNS